MLILRPSSVRASLFGGLLKNNALAETTPYLNSTNSQTMFLLQANASSGALLNDKKKDQKLDPNATVNIVGENSLLPSVTPISGSPDLADEAPQTSVYVIRKGDSLAQIANMFNVTVNTILWANDMKKGDKLTEGDVLLILPISGLEHTVAKGQTLKSIAALYKADVTEIVQYNDIDINTELAAGSKLVIPNAERDGGADTEPSKGTKTPPKGKPASGGTTVKSSSGFFINPVPGAVRTRGIKPGHRGVDLAAPTGTPIRAAAGGTVIIARNGYNGGFGNYVVIQHSNGTKTLYAHMSKLGATTGEKVSQGETIGYVGSTGRSTGPHLHIEVLGGKNPL